MKYKNKKESPPKPPKKKKPPTKKQIAAAKKLLEDPDTLYRKDLAKQHPEVDPTMCVGQSNVYDGDGRRVLGPNNRWLKKPCEKKAKPGMRVCDWHGAKAPQNQWTAEEILKKYRERAADRITELAEQGDDLKVALGASLAVLKQQKVIKEYKDDSGGGQPKVFIGIQFGALQTGGPPKIVGRILPPGADTQIHEAEVEIEED